MHSQSSRARRALAITASSALVILGSGAAVLAMTGQASATNDGNQAICHATNADGNQYVSNAPAKSGDLNGHAGHTGPLWGPDLKSHHISWGDIIPPFDYPDGQGGTAHFPGLNWPAGQATFLNGCDFVPPTLDLTVVKTNNADGLDGYNHEETAPTAGSAVPFHVTVTNNGDAPVVIDSLVDAIGGTPIDFNCQDADGHSLVGQTVAVGDTVSCDVTLADYSPAASGSKTNEVTVDGHQGGDCVLGDNQAELRIAAVAEETCNLQEDPGNTVSGSDTSVVDTAAEPQPSVTPTETVSPTPTATETTGGGGTVDSPSPTESPFTGGGGTVTLPHTGLPAAVLVAFAGGMLALGGWLTFVGRRRNA